MLSAREERNVVDKIGKNPRLSSHNCEELLKILQGKLYVTKQFAVCCISMAFMVEKY